MIRVLLVHDFLQHLLVELNLIQLFFTVLWEIYAFLWKITRFLLTKQSTPSVHHNSRHEALCSVVTSLSPVPAFQTCQNKLDIEAKLLIYVVACDSLCTVSQIISSRTPITPWGMWHGLWTLPVKLLSRAATEHIWWQVNIGWGNSLMPSGHNELNHYNGVIMGTMASQITSLKIVYSTVIQAQIKENIKAPRHWPLCGELTGDRWIPRTKGQ